MSIADEFDDYSKKPKKVSDYLDDEDGDDDPWARIGEEDPVWGVDDDATDKKFDGLHGEDDKVIPLKPRREKRQQERANAVAEIGANGDIENGKAFARKHQDEFLYVDADSKWMQWGGTRWEDCPASTAEASAKKLAGELLDKAYEAYKRVDSPANKSAFARARTVYMEMNKVRRILDAAKSESGMYEPSMAAFDQDPFKLGVQNGVIDLKTGKFMKADPTQRISKQGRVDYVPGQDCPLFLGTLNRAFCGDQDLISFFQRLAGYTMLGIVDEEIWVFMFGYGANGKTTLMNVLAAVMGDYAREIESMALSCHPNADSSYQRVKASLPGVRLAMANETEADQVFNDRAMKELASRDTLSARLLHHELFNFAPSHKLWVRGNSLPGARDQTKGFWRRAILLKFGSTFNVGTDSETDTAKAIKNFDKIIMEQEGPGVLNWLIQGCLDYQKHGIDRPKSVIEDTNKYRKDTDIVGQWLDERCRIDDSAEELSKTLYSDYCAHLTGMGVKSPGSQIAFNRMMESRGFEVYKDERGKVVTGIKIASAYDSDRW